MALTMDGDNSTSAWAWGDNDYGQLGQGPGNASTSDSLLPLKVKAPDGGFLTGLKAIAAGGSHSLALKTDGTVLAWGENRYGQLGNGTTGGTSSLPVRVIDPSATDLQRPLSGVVAIEAGGAHSLAHMSDGTVRAWGRNLNGQLGDGTFVDRPVPVQVIDPNDTTRFLTGVKALAAGSDHSLAVKGGASDADNTVRAWGRNDQGQLGTGIEGSAGQLSGVSVPAPVLAGPPPSTTPFQGAVSLDAGAFHTLALKADGTVWAWGSGDQLGNETGARSNHPSHVKDPSNASEGPNKGLLIDVVRIAASGEHSLALRGNGIVLAWGRNVNGQIGNGEFGAAPPMTRVTTALEVKGLSGVALLDAGEGHSLAVTGPAPDSPTETATTTTSTTTTTPTSTSTTTTPTSTTTTTVPPTTTTLPTTTSSSTTTTLPTTTTSSSTSTTSSSTTSTVPTSTTSSSTTSTTVSGGGTSSTTSTSSPTSTTSTSTPASGSQTSRRPTVQANPPNVVAGEQTLATGSGFSATQLRLTLFSDPVLLATTLPDASGNYRAMLTIPANTSPGPHRLVASNADGSEQASTTVVVRARSAAAPRSSAVGGRSLPRTGGTIAWQALVASVLLALGTSAVITTRPRPSRPSHPMSLPLRMYR